MNPVRSGAGLLVGPLRRGQIQQPVTDQLKGLGSEGLLDGSVLVDGAGLRALEQVIEMGAEERRGIIARCTAELGTHDAPVREFELVGYTFEFSMDYGAYREFKRHRMMSSVSQPPTVALGYRVPQVIVDAGLEELYRGAVARGEQAYEQVAAASPGAAQYLVTHAHYRRILARINLRECYHLFKLRTSDLAHFSIQEPMLEAMKLAVDTQPQLFRHLKLRDFPEWWPFPRS